MSTSGMLSRVALVRTEVSGEASPSIISVTRIGELGTLAACCEEILSVVLLHSVRNIQEDDIHQF
jgi:hypothetical protein